MEQPRQPSGTSKGGQWGHKPVADDPAPDPCLSLDDLPEIQTTHPVRKVAGLPWRCQPKGKVKGRTVSFAIETDVDGNEAVIPSTRVEETYYTLSHNLHSDDWHYGHFWNDPLGLAIQAGNILAEMLQNGQIDPNGDAVHNALKATASRNALNTTDLSTRLAATKSFQSLTEDNSRGGLGGLPFKIRKCGFKIGFFYDVVDAERAFLMGNAEAVQYHLTLSPPTFHDDGTVSCAELGDGYLKNEDGTSIGYVGQNGELLWQLLLEPAYENGSTPIQHILENEGYEANTDKRLSKVRHLLTSDHGVTGWTLRERLDLVLVAALADNNVASEVSRTGRKSFRCFRSILDAICHHAEKPEQASLWQNQNTRLRLLNLINESMPESVGYDHASRLRMQALRLQRSLSSVTEPETAEIEAARLQTIAHIQDLIGKLEAGGSRSLAT